MDGWVRVSGLEFRLCKVSSGSSKNHYGEQQDQQLDRHTKKLVRAQACHICQKNSLTNSTVDLGVSKKSGACNVDPK